MKKYELKLYNKVISTLTKELIKLLYTCSNGII